MSHTRRPVRYAASILLALLVSLAAATAQSPEDKTPRLVVQTGHASDVTSVAFSPDGRLLATGSLDGTVKLWDSQTRRELKTLSVGTDAADTVFSVAFSPDGKTLASGGSRQTTVKLWDVVTGELRQTLSGHTHYVMSVAFSPDGKMLASGSWDDTVRLWNAHTGREVFVLTGHTSDVYSVAFSPDGKTLASGGWKDAVKLWDVQSGRELQTLPGHTTGVSSVAFSPDGKTVAAGTRAKTIKFWDVASGRQMSSIDAHTYVVTSIAFSPDGKTLASSESGRGVKLWDVRSGQRVRIFSEDTSAARSVAFSPDGKILASSSGNAVRLWGAQTGQELKNLSGHTFEIRAAAFSPDGKTIAVGSVDQTVRLWDVRARRRLRRLAGHAGEIWSVMFSPDGTMLASLAGSLNMTVILWDVETGKELLTLPGDTAFAFSPDSKIFATGARDKSIKLWDVATRRPINTLTGSTSQIQKIVFSPDGETIATGGYKTVRLWDVRSGRALEPLIGHDGSVWDVAFSSDGKLCATGSEDHTAIIWDLELRKPLKVISEHGGSVWDVAFSPDGKSLASRSGNQYILISDVASGRALESFEHSDADTTRRVHALVPALYRDSRYEPVSPDDRFQIRVGANSRLDLYSVPNAKLLAGLITLDERDWAAVTPDGHFDTSRNLSNNIDGLHWIFPDAPLEPLSLNIFMRDYFEPHLLPRMLKGEEFPALPSLAELNRLQPRVGSIRVLPRADDPDTVNVEVEVESVAGRCVRRGRREPCESGVYDLRLYRGLQLIGQSPESAAESSVGSSGKQSRQGQLREWRKESVVRLDGRRPVTAAGGKRKVTFHNIRLPRRPDATRVAFTAYAFNEDRVKSETSEPAVHALPAQRAATTPRRAYLITVGVDATSARNWRLIFAPNGARDVEGFLTDRLRARYEVVPVQLISEFQDDGVGFKQSLATKANIRAALDILAGRQVRAEQREQIPNQERLRAATPDDLVIIYIASHGYATPAGAFYLMPSDLGVSAEVVSETLLTRCLTTAERSDECRAAHSFLEHSISSGELTEWVRAIDAGEMTLILDSCHSAAVSGPNFKPGPMGDRGFGQLSYDKGMRVLAATQVENVALGTLALNDRSLLVHVLTKLTRSEPFDMDSWLEEAERDVPRLYKEHPPDIGGQPQEPIFFNFVND